MEREWAIGRQLNLLNEDDGFLEGFTQTGSKILDKDGSFLGTVLEKLNGTGSLKRLQDPKFNDIDYILEMMTQVKQLVVWWSFTILPISYNVLEPTLEDALM